MNTEFKRESVSRHQSERLLDRNLLTYERKQPLQEYERAIEKKVKKAEEEKKINQEIIAKMKSEDIKPQDALERIVKAFDNPKKCSKALAIYKDLLSKNFDSLETDHVFYSLYLLMKNFPIMSSADDKKTINAIFQFFETKKDQILRTGEFKIIYNIWCYEGLVHPQVFTDDSYQLNGAIKKTKELIEDLNKPEDEIDVQISEPEPKPVKTDTAPKTDISLIRQKLMKKKEELAPETKPEPIETAEPVLPKYEFKIPQECLDEIKNPAERKEWRRKILFEITKDIYGLYKHTWAKPIVKQYFDQIYLEREVFNEEQKKGVEDFKAGLSNLKGLDTVKGFKRDTLDSKIMSNPLASGNEVKDARATSFSFDSIGKWAGRQSGI